MRLNFENMWREIGRLWLWDWTMGPPFFLLLEYTVRIQENWDLLKVLSTYEMKLWSLCHHSVWLRFLSLWMLHKSQNSIGHCHNWWKPKVISCNSKSYSFVIQSFLISSDFLCELRNIEKGNHDDYFLKNIARDTKKGMVKNYQIVNSKETNTKSWVMVGLW